MKAYFISLFVMIGLSLQSYGQNQAIRLQHYNIKKSVGLEGYDPVSYFTGTPLEGNSNKNYTYLGVMYWFANDSNLNKFKADPEKYEPAYGGWCAYAMGETGEKVKVDPETFKIVNGKLYLFYNFWGNNTLTDWNKNEKSLQSKADQNWKKIVQ